MLDDMTNIKASEVLKELKDYTEDLPHYSPDEVAEALEMAIKALVQQPFINKPCISEGVCREDKIQVLDKIRAEIEDLVYYNWGNTPRTVIDDVLKVIDKYKTESEDME